MLRLIAHRIENLDRRSLLLVLNALALTVALFVAFRYNYLHPDNVGRLMYSTPDTREYRDLGDWLLGKIDQVPPSAIYRTFLYPLFIGSVRQITENPYVFWAVQFVLWLAAINLIAVSIFRLTNRKSLLIVSFCILALNVSAIILTFYALTEIFVIFLTAAWLFEFAIADLHLLKPRQAFVLILLLSMMTVAKPVFQIHLLIFLAFIFFSGIRNKMIWLAGFGIFPVAFQMFANWSTNGSFNISDISQVTLKLYYLAQVYALGNHISLDEARIAVSAYDSGHMITYLTQNSAASFTVYMQNLKASLTGGSELVEYYFKPYVFSRITDLAFLIAHIIFFPAMIKIIFTKSQALALKVKLLYIFSVLIIVTSAFSGSGGDRLTIIALPFWIAAYSCVPVLLFNANAVHPAHTHG